MRKLAKTYQLKNWQKNWQWHERARASERHIFKMAAANLPIVIGHCRNHRVAIQAGGHCGIWPNELANHFGTVYTFEPDADNFKALAVNASGWNIFPMRAVLGDENKCVELRVDAESGHDQVLGKWGYTPQIRLDDLNLQEVDLIYLDIEGYELAALRGAISTILHWKPIIAVEATGKISADGCHMSTTQVHDWLQNKCGYKFIDKINKDAIYGVV